MLNTMDDLITFVENDSYLMSALKLAKSRKLPQWFLGAGFVRNTVWDIQHGRTPSYDYNDIDLGYYDFDNQSEANDQTIAHELRDVIDVSWEIVNQAYAHHYNDVPPYTSGIDGLAHWIETATAVGVTLDENDKVIVLAPWGVEDLLQLKLRLSPCHTGNEFYEKLFKERIQNKEWLKKWPKLQVV